MLPVLPEPPLIKITIDATQLPVRQAFASTMLAVRAFVLNIYWVVYQDIYLFLGQNVKLKYLAGHQLIIV